MPEGNEGLKPDDKGLEALSEMYVDSSGYESEADKQAHEDLLVERRQEIAEAKGELVEPTETDPAKVEEAMAVHSDTWESKEQQQ